MASGRGGVDYQGRALLPVARGRPGGAYPRCAGAASTRPASGQTLLSQITQRTAIRTAGADHGQTEELRRCKDADHAGCRASAAQGVQQPGRSLAPANPAAGTPDAAIQIAVSGPTFFIGAWPHQ